MGRPTAGVTSEYELIVIIISKYVLFFVPLSLPLNVRLGLEKQKICRAGPFFEDSPRLDLSRPPHLFTPALAWIKENKSSGGIIMIAKEGEENPMFLRLRSLLIDDLIIHRPAFYLLSLGVKLGDK